MKLTLTPSELKMFTKLTTEMDRKGLREFLADRLPLSMVDEIQSVLLTAAAAALDDGTEEPMQFIVAAVREQAAEPSEEASAEPAGEPSPPEEPSEEPSAEPDENSTSPEPNPSPSDKEEEDDQGVPLGWPFQDDDEG